MDKTTLKVTASECSASVTGCSALDTVVFCTGSCAIRFIATFEIGCVFGVTHVSAKWRRSRRWLKWVNSENPAMFAKRTYKVLRVQKFKSPAGMHPRKLGFPREFAKENLKEPQPLIDIFQEDTCVVIVAEIAGFNRETFKIDVKDQKLTLQAKAKDRKYYKSLNLPKEVIPNIFHTTYKNGVLEIKLRKACTQETIKKQLG